MKKLMAGVLAAALWLGATGCTAGKAPAGSAPGAESTAPSGVVSSSAAIPQAVANSQAQPDIWPVVETSYGRVEGQTEEGVTAFKGVPYAAPPVGELRFAPPQAPANWGETLPCTEFKPDAMQTGKAAANGMNEDCLYLNIWAPEDAPQQGNLPVLVFFHGGGFASGSPSNAMYSGQRFAKDGVIQVNVAYRLNALGFLSTQAALEEYGSPGNAGVMDQIFALEWVRDNIAAFGGNPANVTISGESAGAFSVSNMMMSPMAEGLFARAILESGNSLGQAMICPEAGGDMNQALAMGNAFAEKLKAGGTETNMGQADLAALRALPAEDLVKNSVFSTDITKPSAFYFAPVFDGMVLPEDPYGAVQRGEMNDVPILAGFNTDEGTLFIPNGIGASTYTELLQRCFGERAAEVEARFPVDKENTPTQRARELVRLGFRLGNDIFAEELSLRGQAVYYYQLDHLPAGLPSGKLGVQHGAELPFVFDTLAALGATLDEEGEAFKEDLHGRWLGFIQNGDPNGGAGQRGDDWPLYTVETPEMLRFGETPTAEGLPASNDIAFLRELLWENGG